MKLENIENLLKETKPLCIQKEKESVESAKRGDYFNIFEILGVQTRETRLHSAFIAEFLNRNGSHGLGDQPLKLFLKQCSEIKIDEFDTENSSVFIEYYLGKIDSENLSGGRIDLLITDNQKNIVIENKIYAIDQKNQLLRYKHAENINQPLILYLTLDGHEASKEATGSKMQNGIDYYCLSYEKNIFSWLEQCKNIPDISSTIKETIEQYLKLIKKLTKKNMVEEDQKFLHTLENNIEATQEILKNSENIRNYLIKNYLIDPIKKWADKIGLICENNLDSSKNYTGIVFYKSEWKKQIKLEFQGRSYRDLIYGACWRNENKIDDKCDVFPTFKQNQNNGWPNGWKSAEKFRDLGFDNLSKIKNEEVFEYYKSLVEAIFNAIKEEPERYGM